MKNAKYSLKIYVFVNLLKMITHLKQKMQFINNAIHVLASRNARRREI